MTAVIALGCVRSCGVTTTAATLAAAWPASRRLLLVEVNPAGGDLAARYGLPSQPGLVSLAAAARRRMDPSMVWAHTQTLSGTAAVLTAPVHPAQTRSALALLPGLADQLPAVDADVLTDCGRLEDNSTALPFWRTARLRLVVVRPHLVDLHHLAGWLDTAPAGDQPARLVLVGRPGYPAAEIADTFGVPVLGALPDDPAAVDALPAGLSRSLGRTPLLRHARTLTTRLFTHVDLPSIHAAEDRSPVAPPATGMAAAVLPGAAEVPA